MLKFLRAEKRHSRALEKVEFDFFSTIVKFRSNKRHSRALEEVKFESFLQLW